MLNLSVGRVRQFVQEGRLVPVLKLPRALLFAQSDIEALAQVPRKPGRSPKPPPPTRDERTAQLQALLAAHPELTEIAIDRARQGGKPCIKGTRIPVDFAASFYRSTGNDLAVTQTDGYDITQEQAEQALVWEQIVREVGDG